MNIYEKRVDKAFWEDFNQPWLDVAIARGDRVYRASPLTDIYRFSSTSQLTGFGDKIEYLESSGYNYDPITKMMVWQRPVY